MTNEEIYQSALHLAGEAETTDRPNADYRAHSGYFIAAMCRQCEPAENAYRTAKGLGKVTLPEGLAYSLTATFPLSAPLAAPVAFGVAALLTADENPDLSATLHDRFRQAIANLLRSLPMQPESIVQRYASLWQ